MGDGFRLAIVSGKLGDVDGVSLETDKWIQVLGEQGHGEQKGKRQQQVMNADMAHSFSEVGVRAHREMPELHGRRSVCVGPAQTRPQLDG